MRPMGIHHLLTYNISIQYVLVIHVHVTYRVCTSEVKTDEETKNHPLPLLRRNSNIKRCILCIWNAFSWRTGLCLLPLSILQFLCRGTSGNQDTKRNARQPGASSKADSGTSNFRSDLATGHPSKPEAYRWVADKFCLTDKQAHIGQFSNYMCDQLIRESADVLKNNHIPSASGQPAERR